jgi:hypothetical protein
MTTRDTQSPGGGTPAARTPAARTLAARTPAAGALRLTEQECYELLVHLVASADICRFEPHYYGSFRLIDAASQLIGHMLRHGDGGPDDRWLRRYQQELDDKKVWMMWDRPGYFEFLGEAAGPLARRLAERAARVDVPDGRPSGEEAR